MLHRIDLRIPDEVWEEVGAAAKEMGTSRNVVLQYAWELAKSRVALATPKKKTRRRSQLRKRLPRWTE